MSITRHHTGRFLYQFDARIEGRRTRANRLLPTGWSRAQADKYDSQETARLYQVATGQKSQDRLIDDAVLIYLKEHAPSLKNFADLVGALNIMHPWYAGQPMSALPSIAKQYTQDNSETLSLGTIRNRLAYLRAACRWAWKNHSMGEHDPGERMQLPKAGRPRQNYLSREQMLRITKVMPHKPSRIVVKVAFYTGLRLSEILRSMPVQSLGGQALAIQDTKNDEPHIVPVHPRIAHLIRSKDWPPVVHKSTVSHYAKKAMQAVNLDQFRFHDLRHSAASEMINAGVDLYTVGAVLNHKSAVSTKRYAHLSTDRIASAIKKIGLKNKKIA